MVNVVGDGLHVLLGFWKPSSSVMQHAIWSMIALRAGAEETSATLGLILSGHLAAMCPGLPQMWLLRSSIGTMGLRHNLAVCPGCPQLAHLTSRASLGGVATLNLLLLLLLSLCGRCCLLFRLKLIAIT